MNNYKTGDGKRFATQAQAIEHANNVARQKNIIISVEEIKRKQTMIKKVFVINDGGFSFGMDSVTPVSWVFSNRKPKNMYAEYNLSPFTDNAKVQEWIAQNKKVCMSLVELREKLKALAA